MSRKSLICALISCVMLAAPLSASAQRMARSVAKAASAPAAGYASVALRDGYADESYSASVVETLRERYGLNVSGASKNPSLRWEVVDTLPPGLALQESTGVIFGTPIRARTQAYLFRLHVYDDSVANPSPLRLQISLAVLNGQRPGPAPALTPVAQDEPAVQTAAADSGQASDSADGDGQSGRAVRADADVEVPAILPRKEATIPLIINNPDVRQVKVSVIDKDDKVLNFALTPEDLPRGVVRTFVKVTLEQGENRIRISNFDTGEVYKTIRVVLKATDVDKPAPGAAIQIRHSGFEKGDATKTPVTVVVNDSKINKVKITTRSQDEKGVATAWSGGDKTLDLKRGQNEYTEVVTLDPDPKHVTVVTAASVTADPKDSVSAEKPVEIRCAGAGDKPKVEVGYSGLVGTETQVVPLQITVNDQKVSKIRVVVTPSKKADEKNVTDQHIIALGRGDDSIFQPVGMPAGDDATVRVYDLSKVADPKKEPKTLDDIKDEPEILTAFSIKRREGRADSGVGVEVRYSGLVSSDVQVVPLEIEVNDPKISRIRVVVTPVKKKDEPDKEAKEKKVVHQYVVGLARGEDSVLRPIELPTRDDARVRFYNLSGVDEPKGDLASIDDIPKDEPEITDVPPVIIRRREGGGASAQASTILTNSMTTRAIVGFEQAGASAAESASKPFLDFFFSAPIRYKPLKDDLPRLSTWGQVRLAALPRQVTNFGTFSSNFVNPLADDKLVDLVQGFDFMAGLEARVFGTNKSYVGLIPGVRQQTFMHVVAGGGAISPLSPREQGAQIFQVPGAGNPQRQLFIDRYGQEAADKKYIAFVFPDRDRFLRQYYAGLRFKTFYYAGDGSLINRFPAILDVMIGQNEAVTGGKLKNDVTNEKGRITGRKRSYVLRLEAFYPFPIKEASFLYLYGTAMMKVGGGGVKVTTPLFLTGAGGDVQVTGDDVFIAPTLQSNRDYYRFGIGVNLNELFNRKPPPEEK